MDILKGLRNIVHVFDTEEIPYMIVGGFATSYYNLYRFTADIDINVQMYPFDIEKIVKYFPDWLPMLESYKQNAEKGIVFNLTDFDSGVKYDFMLYQDSDYNWAAFERRKKVAFSGITCFIASPEDLIISKLIWYNLSKSGKQKEDIEFLLELDGLNKQYLENWAFNLQIKRHGLF